MELFLFHLKENGTLKDSGHPVFKSISAFSRGNSVRENIQDFESLYETIRFTRVCEGASFVHRVPAGMSYKNHT